MYQLTLRPKPGSDAIRNLRHALKALGRRYHLDVVEIKPLENLKPRQNESKAANAERQARHRQTPVHQFWGENISWPPEDWSR